MDVGDIVKATVQGRGAQGDLRVRTDDGTLIYIKTKDELPNKTEIVVSITGCKRHTDGKHITWFGEIVG